MPATYLDARRKLNAVNEELAKLRAKDITIKEFARGDLAVKKILELKNKREGIYGTVADLGNVSSKYAVAIEVAAGPRVKSIVVENDKLAAELIRYLKDNRLGMATFLPMNKLFSKDANPDIKKLLEAKGVHDLAINLVTFEPKFKKVFSYVFSDTLIVDDISVATRIGVGKAKFVTLDGDTAEVSGAMHGGFRERRKEAFGFREREVTENIQINEKKVGELSGGERIRAALAICLMSQHPPQLIILDEPTNHLDTRSIESIENILTQYQGAILAVSHDEQFLKNINIERTISLVK